jgi:hypothetical protein
LDLSVLHWEVLTQFLESAVLHLVLQLVLSQGAVVLQFILDLSAVGQQSVLAFAEGQQAAPVVVLSSFGWS